MKSFLISLALFSPFAVFQVHAQTQTAATVATADWTDAEIRKLDKEGKKITLKHGPIKNLDMPGMTMVFMVKDGVNFDQFRVGDIVQFKAISEGNKYFVIEIQASK